MTSSILKVREVVCVLCPIGCHINIEIRDGEIVAIKGAGCKRGTEYGEKEVRSPMRDFFTTVRIRKGRIPMLSVRSTNPIPKEMLMDCAKELSRIVVSAPIKMGDIIAKNIMDSGIDIIATKDVEET